MSNPPGLKENESEIQILIATDVMSEGLNLQDAGVVINYDLHWNPVRLIQRIGRIDRIGSEFDKIVAYNFLPEKKLEKNLKLHEKLRLRIQEIHDNLGEDHQILDKTERLNEEAIYAIYEKRVRTLDSFIEDDTEDFSMSEAEEIIRDLKRNNPGEFERIKNLPNGLRSAKKSDEKGVFLMVESGDFKSLVVLDSDGNIVSRDFNRIMALIKAGKKERTKQLPGDMNAIVRKGYHQIVRELREREGKREARTKPPAVRAILRKLEIIQNDKEPEGQDWNRITHLRKVYALSLPPRVNRELKNIQKLEGEELLEALEVIYKEYSLHNLLINGMKKKETYRKPVIVCSEALL